MPKAAGLEARIIRAMKQVGFTESHARAYLALLKSHPATGYELAAKSGESGVPRSAIYTEKPAKSRGRRLVFAWRKAGDGEKPGTEVGFRLVPAL